MTENVPFSVKGMFSFLMTMIPRFPRFQLRFAAFIMADEPGPLRGKQPGVTPDKSSIVQMIAQVDQVKKSCEAWLQSAAQMEIIGLIHPAAGEGGTGGTSCACTSTSQADRNNHLLRCTAKVSAALRYVSLCHCVQFGIQWTEISLDTASVFNNTRLVRFGQGECC